MGNRVSVDGKVLAAGNRHRRLKSKAFLADGQWLIKLFKKYFKYPLVLGRSQLGKTALANLPQHNGVGKKETSSKQPHSGFIRQPVLIA